MRVWVRCGVGWVMPMPWPWPWPWTAWAEVGLGWKVDDEGVRLCGKGMGVAGMMFR